MMVVVTNQPDSRVSHRAELDRSLDLPAFLEARYAEIAETFECEGSAEYRDCFDKSAARLRDIDAMRQVVRLHSPNEHGLCGVCVLGTDEQRNPCPTLRLLALPYAQHLSYRKEWRP